jgi:hypothetical protein
LLSPLTWICGAWKTSWIASSISPMQTAPFPISIGQMFSGLLNSLELSCLNKWREWNRINVSIKIA